MQPCVSPRKDLIISVWWGFFPNFAMLRARLVPPDLRMPVMLHIKKEREQIALYVCGEGGDIKMTSVWLTCL